MGHHADAGAVAKPCRARLLQAVRKASFENHLFSGPFTMTSDLPEASSFVASGFSVDVLRRVPTLEGLDSATLAMIAETASFQTLGSGERLIRKGDAAETLYLVLTGRFRVVSDGATIATIGPGEPIGELAFFSGGQRSADVLAMRDSTLLELDRHRHDTLVAAVPGLASGIRATVAARLAGGGAFGTAHPGACKARQESGIAIDFPGGTSIGAAMAAAIARGPELDEIMCRTNDDFVINRAMDRLRIAAGLLQSGV